MRHSTNSNPLHAAANLIENAHHAMGGTQSKSLNYIDAIKHAAKEFNVDTKYVDLVIRVSFNFVEACLI
jgi:hypothetical protein